jgi:hypothetical protein
LGQQDILSTTLNIQLEEEEWKQAKLPVKFGGLGIRSPKCLALPSFLASFTQNKNIIEMILQKENVVDPIYEQGLHEWSLQTKLTPPNTINCKQSEFDLPLVEKEVLSLKENASGANLIRLSSICDSRSGAEWINALPMKPCGLFMSNEELRINIGIRLGARISESYQCKNCSSTVDEKGTHGLSCRLAAGKQSRHHEANNIILRALTSTGHYPISEPTGLSRSDGKRADGMTRLPWKKGLPLIWDFTCVDTLAPSRVTNQITSAAEKAERQKEHKYQHLQDRYIFQPVAVETLGSWGPSSLIFLKDLGKYLNEKSDDPRAGYFLRQRLSVAVARGNAAAIISCMGNEHHLILPHD